MPCRTCEHGPRTWTTVDKEDQVFLLGQCSHPSCTTHNQTAQPCSGLMVDRWTDRSKFPIDTFLRYYPAIGEIRFGEPVTDSDGFARERVLRSCHGYRKREKKLETLCAQCRYGAEPEALILGYTQYCRAPLPGWFASLMDTYRHELDSGRRSATASWDDETTVFVNHIGGQDRAPVLACEAFERAGEPSKILKHPAPEFLELLSTGGDSEAKEAT